ncbi:MAG TPA: helix-turn-helix domain-containing protein [Candidatus Hydrogenedentes bacterium]|nr:helix-turn-helix domain-containing protein [Candidatus Hydrogenedentota bacterium]
MDPSNAGELIKNLRKEKGVSLREISRQVGVSPASLSAIEKGQSSPTLATLHRILKGLGTDFAEFFANPSGENTSPVFPSRNIRCVSDAYRVAELLFPKRDDFRFEMLFETVMPLESEPEWEVHDCDVGGVVLEGGPMRLEIEGVGEWTLGAKDAFYVKAGLEHRATNLGKNPLRLVTTYEPPRY